MTTDTFQPFDTSIRSRARERASAVFRRLSREPLLHFFLLGAALFVLNAVIAPAIPQERLISFTAEDKKTIIDAFVEGRGRQPTTDELKRLIDDWVLNEITYREALAQGFDKGDEMIRQRLMQKMSVLIFSNVNVQAPTEEQLQQWLEDHRAQYDVPQRLSFFELPMGESKAEAETTLNQILQGKESESVRLRAHTFAERPTNSLIGAFTKEFIDQLIELPVHEWRTLKSSDSWHIVRLESVIATRRVDLDEVRIPVTEEWKQAQARANAVAEVHRMGKAYVVEGIDRR